MPEMVQAFVLSGTVLGSWPLLPPLASVCSAPPAPLMPRRATRHQSSEVGAQQRLGLLGSSRRRGRSGSYLGAGSGGSPTLRGKRIVDLRSAFCWLQSSVLLIWGQ